MNRQSAKLLRLFIFILLIPSVPLLPQKVYEKELNIQDQSGNYSNPSATTSLIQTFPPLPPSGRNGSFLGEVVASLGDVNGDGYDDFAIGLKHGAVYPSGLKLGKVYIYFGSNTLSSEQNPDLILTGETDSDRFGYSVASAGDVNNDGFPDIIIGAYFNSAVTLQQGRAYLYFGGPALDNVPDAVFTGEDLKDYFGFSVSSAGDVNNDGFSDLIVGAHFNSRGAEFSGSAYLYLGGTEPDNIPDLIFTGEGELDNFGNSVASAGDVNNDGFSDVIVGAFLNNRGGPDAGSAYLYFGGTAMDNIPDLIFSGTETSGHFGTSAASAGDLNNDGFSDIIIGNPLGNVFSGGRSWIYFGGAPMDNIPDVIAAGESGFDNFGAFVSAAGDVNNDGFSDVIVGATSGGFNITGRAYIYFGSTEMDSIPDLIFEGEANQDFFGTSVSAAGDINNDGFDDVIAGAYMNDGGGKDVGKAYVYYGAAGMDNTADIIFTGEKSYDNYGNSVSSAGDVNNDGFSDIIVGAYSNDDAAPDAGSAYLYFGGNGIEITPDIIFYGDGLSDGFGISASSAGDLNNDSFSDVIIGSYFHNSGGLASGSAYIYFGGTAMDNTADLILAGEGSFENFGNSVASAGDMNNDGFSDLIVGAYASDSGGFDAGRAYIYFGGNPMDNIPDVIFTGEAVVDYFGTSVSSAGDVNNDGFSDVIIGANFNEAGGEDAGRAYLYFGGTSMDNTADIIFESESSLDRFGTDVSSTDDVNNDGFSDVIIGASLGGVNAEGKAYLYFGGTAMDNIPDFIFTGESLGDGFGTSVSSAGDVNKDGFSDIIIGAYHNGANDFNSGRAYIYFGGNPPDNIPDATFTGQASSDLFGVSVSSAGDVNNDGFSDMVVGAMGSCAVGYEMGRAYLYAGGDEISSANDKKNILTEDYQLFQSYPNPFNPETKITFSLPENSDINLVVYDILGREIITLENNELASGYYERSWRGIDASGNQISSGIYFYRLNARGKSGKEYSKVMKMVMVK